MKNQKHDRPLTLLACMEQIEEAVRTAKDYMVEKSTPTPKPCCSWLGIQLDLGTFGFETTSGRLFVHNHIGFLHTCPRCGYDWGKR